MLYPYFYNRCSSSGALLRWDVLGKKRKCRSEEVYQRIYLQYQKYVRPLATVLLCGVFLIADCYLFLIADIPYESIGVCALVILTVLYLFVASQIFLLASQFDNSFKQTIANAFLISFAYPIRSIVHIILLVLPVVVFLFLPKVFVHAGLLWFLLYFSLEVYLDSLIIRPVYARLQTQKSE